jgi:tetratricopeptide (TPR) repeat protein
MDTQLTQLRTQARQAFERREYDVALELFLRIAGLQPAFADVRHSAGLCYSFLGDAEAALEQFDYALAANPGYVEAHINRALTLNELGRFDDAQQAFERAARFEEEVAGPFPTAAADRLANAHAALGDLYAAAGGVAEAVEQYRRALELRPRFHDIRNKLALSLLEQGQNELAASELRTVLDGNPRFLAARMNLGLAYHRLGHTDRARREWELAASQDPEHPQVRAYLSLLTGTVRSDA